MSKFKRDDVEVIDDQLSWKGFFSLRSLRLRHRLFGGGWGAPINRELMVRGAAVGVLPYDPERDEVLLIEQFRVGALQREGGPWLKELVAGLIDKDESPEQVARREAVEEAGVSLDELAPIGRYFSSPGGSDEYFYLFCGRCHLAGAGGHFGLPEEGEDIRASVYSFAEALAMMARGEVDNAHTIIALQWLALNRDGVRKGWLSE
ncbi:NUDIX domain-containing protein [Spongiibacter taiwanensis]|uniref:NUDIX domain-containing protein n=1 Tax=Spongiibacter taiwanensis TaxID=1748242 RepID=UPI0020356562|nr:NUDIX domain-containing protein [Spongiibacter taiwanensis]USA44208.1 NUDIX domain-containing protein [Spongiibacter taiwanensis]